MKESIYLDYAAATPIADEVLEVMRPFWQDGFHNPSSLYLAGREAKQALDGARANISHWLGVRPGEIVFTAGATEANQLVIQGVLKANPSGKVIVSAGEHASVLDSAAAHKDTIQVAPIDNLGRIQLDRLEQLITAKTVLVSAQYANNETGTIQPLKRISAIIKAERDRRQKAGVKLPIYLHSDASQAAQYLDLHTSRLGLDFMTISAGKIYGPKQVAALFIKGSAKLESLLAGGGQEKGLRSGTENIAGAVGLARALELVQSSRREEQERVANLRDKLQSSLPGNVVVQGHPKHRLPNFLHISIPGKDGERLVMELDETSIMAATGAACSANSDKPSHVLTAMGLTSELIQGSVRFSLGRPTTENQIRAAARVLRNLSD